jgi:hypothetical protein
MQELPMVAKNSKKHRERTSAFDSLQCHPSEFPHAAKILRRARDLSRRNVGRSIALEQSERFGLGTFQVSGGLKSAFRFGCAFAALDVCAFLAALLQSGLQT